MTKAFEDQISKIKSQAATLETLDERAVELGVILPLLKRLGWDTEDMTQIYPQKVLPNESKVDYSLQSNGSSRVFIEAKRWSHALTEEDENQLRKYCLASKPDLAVLTNGRHWRLYLPPLRTRRRGQEPELRQFLVFDITDEPREVEKNFRRFLAYDKMVSSSVVRKTVDDARGLFKEKQNHAAVMKGLVDAWNDLANDESVLSEIVTALAEKHGVQPNAVQVKQFLQQKGTLVNEVSDASGSKTQKHIRPTSFAIRRRGYSTIARPVAPKSWNKLLIDICLLMEDLHHENFRQTILGIPEWFSESTEGFKFSRPVGDTGIYLKHGNTAEIRKLAPLVISKFGYPPESLTIEEK